MSKMTREAFLVKLAETNHPLLTSIALEFIDGDQINRVRRFLPDDLILKHRISCFWTGMSSQCSQCESQRHLFSCRNGNGNAISLWICQNGHAVPQPKPTPMPVLTSNGDGICSVCKKHY